MSCRRSSTTTRRNPGSVNSPRPRPNASGSTSPPRTSCFSLDSIVNQHTARRRSRSTAAVYCIGARQHCQAVRCQPNDPTPCPADPQAALAGSLAFYHMFTILSTASTSFRQMFCGTRSPAGEPMLHPSDAPCNPPKNDTDGPRRTVRAFPDAPCRNRTYNLVIKSHLLCQLS